MTQPIIVGAGLAGLLAAHAWPRSEVFEVGPRGPQHRALLRFRGKAVSTLTGIEFRRVLVRKGIWDVDLRRFVPPSIQLANLYAQKCIGRLGAERSIWNIEPAERFIAPEDFYDQLVDAVGSRIAWNTPFSIGTHRTPVVSTAPLPAMLSMTKMGTLLEFDRAPISVERWHVENCDVHQTVYFPDAELAAYRASITGSTMIIESRGTMHDSDRESILEAFGLDGGTLRDVHCSSQRFGKIAEVRDDAERKQLLFRLTHECNVYSLGRFATWRNILLDDVVDDIQVIKRMMRAGHYELRKESS